MKKLLFLILLTFSLLCNAGKLTLVEGNTDCLKNAEILMVVLDCSKATYMGDKDLNDFLKKARRRKDWVEKSVDYFCEWFNDKTKRIMAVPLNKEDQFKLDIVVKDVQRSGKITAEIKLIDTKSGKTEAVFDFYSSDGDNNDEITLRDPMKDAGDTIGKYLRKTVELAK